MALEYVCSYDKYSSVNCSFLIFKGRHCCHVWAMAFSLRCGIMYFRQTQVAAHLTFWIQKFPKLPKLTFFLFPSQVGGACKLSTESSQRRCRTPDGKICSGRGTCDCGICICEATEPGKFYGPRCECHDWVCATHNGKTCSGAYNDISIDTSHKQMAWCYISDML